MIKASFCDHIDLRSLNLFLALIKYHLYFKMLIIYSNIPVGCIINQSLGQLGIFSQFSLILVLKYII